jgi:acyl-coenzyme A thioesterase PaaI-like protein
MAVIEQEFVPPHPPPEIYKLVSARLRDLDEDHGEGTLPIRPGLRNLNGPSAAALAVLLQDLSAVTIARFAPLVVPIQINVRIRATAAGVETLIAKGETTRRGRAVQFTDAQYYDAAEPSRVVAFATGSWATMGSNRETPRPGGPGPGTPAEDDPPYNLDFASLFAAIGARERAGGGVELGSVEAVHTEPVALGGSSTGTLHAGALQVLAESAATQAATATVPAERLMIEELSTQFLAPARITPITALGSVVASTDTSIDCRVEVREQSGDGRVCALSYARFAIAS